MKKLRRHDSVAEAAEELQRLRTVAREVHRHALARIEGEIVRVLGCVAKDGCGDSLRQRRGDVRRIVAELKRFDIRAEKGRSKDLRRLDWVVNHLACIVDEWR
jgi:hypothetical protein